MDIEAPIRSGGHVHRCLCRLVHEAADGTRFTDDCAAVATNPDAPLCDPCVASGHEDLPHVPYANVILERGKTRHGGVGPGMTG